VKLRLTDTQREVVDYDAGALLVLAGPGSGKTRVLTERVRRLLANPTQHFRVLALTFTNKAANEMIERLDDIPEIRSRAFVGTLHSFCMEVLANRGKAVGVEGLPHIFESFDDRKQILLAAVRSDPDLLKELRASGDVREQQRALVRWLERIGELKNCLMVPSMVEDNLERRIYEAFDSALRASGALDYDDLLLLTHRLFSERPRIAEFYQRQYRYVCIDEAQDLNEAQYRLLCALCGAEFRNVMMVGDPNQAIYVWNGADPKYLSFFERDFNARRMTLSENFRCSRTVVDAAKRLNSAYEVLGQLPIQGLVEVIPCADEDEEAATVLQVLQELISKGHPDIEGDLTLDRCAVLARNRFLFKQLEAALKARKWPYYKKLSAGAYQSESELVEQFELSLRLLTNSRDQFHLGVLAKQWGIPPDVMAVPDATGTDLVEAMAERACRGDAAVVIKAIASMQWSLRDFKLLPALEVIEQHANSALDEGSRELVLQDIQEWRKSWDFFVRSEIGGEHSLASFLGQIALGATQQPSDPGLGLLTVHSAKGMEFDVVLLIGMVEGVFPDYRASGSALEEEARSAFVAVTRSKRLLYLTYPKTRTMPWGAVKPQQPSRYVRALLRA
jgi:DNA helicase II / ATP-dependent DNA helicase PcrA